MIPLISFLTPPSQCGYLPDRIWQLHYDVVRAAKPSDYERRLLMGWRRFGRSFFRPKCPACQECRSLRVDVNQFVPNRSQRRNARVNEGDIRLDIGEPQVTQERLDLYDRFHSDRAERVGWDAHEPKNKATYFESFLDNPFSTEEWCYYLGEKLVGVGYVDVLSQGLSAIYFFHDPGLHRRGLGTWNVLSLIGEAKRRGHRHVYLGYYVAGCRSSEYKGRFLPAETYDFNSATWIPFEGWSNPSASLS